MINNLDRVTARFEKAVTRLRDNLQYLANEGKVSDKFISLQNAVIKALIDYQHHTTEIIEYLQWDNYELTLAKSKEYHKLEDIKLCFEAICIIHGIMDFDSWMQKGKQYLVSEAVDHYRNGRLQIPFELLGVINELPADRKDLIMGILNERAMRRWEDEFQRNLEKLQNAGT